MNKAILLLPEFEVGKNITSEELLSLTQIRDALKLQGEGLYNAIIEVDGYKCLAEVCDGILMLSKVVYPVAKDGKRFPIQRVRIMLDWVY